MKPDHLPKLSLRQRCRVAVAKFAGRAVTGVSRAFRRLIVGNQATSDRVVIVCDQFLRYGAKQAVGFGRQGFDVTLMYVDRVGNEFGGIRADRDAALAEAAREGVHLVRLDRFGIRSFPRDARRLWSLMRERKPRYAVVHWHYDPRYVVLSLFVDVIYLLHDPKPHSGDSESRMPLPVRAMIMLSAAMSFAVMLHSKRLAPDLPPFLRSLPLITVGHGADVDSEPTPVPSEKVLLLAGRLFAYKGVDTALDAFVKVRVSRPEIRLVVAGRGPMAEIVRGAEGVTLIDRHVTDDEFAELQREATLVLLPYKDATQSGVGLQAIARGIPCIVSDAGGLEDLVGDVSRALVVKPDNPSALARAIEATIDHDDELRASILLLAASKFSWTQVCRQLDEDFRSLKNA